MSPPQPDTASARVEMSVASARIGRQHWPGLDALRGLAMLLGVALHAAVSYMPHAMPDLVWAARDRSVSPLFDWIFWSIHACRLPLFFALAGFFAVQLHESRGTAGYLMHRSRRLLVPLLGASLVLLPLTFGVWTWGWLRSGLCTVTEIRRMKFQPELQSNLYGPAHLWFLEYLYVMCLLFGIACWLRNWLPARLRTSRTIDYDWRDRWLGSTWFPLVPAVLAAFLVWLRPSALSGFHNSFTPEPVRFAYYSVFFATGTWLARARPDLNRYFVPRSGWLVALCVPLLVINALLMQAHLEHGLRGLSRLAFAGNCGLLASLALFGFVGLALRWCPRERPLLRYLADASYWIYLVHFPLVGLTQVLLAPVPVPSVVKFVVVLIVDFAIGFATYHWFVRFTFLGHFLNGTRAKSMGPALPVRSAAA
jgi:glucans biosynthesis protein C